MEKEFQLFRIRLIRPRQKSLLFEETPPSELLAQAIRERPEAEFRAPSVWHIGNVSQLDDDGLYFRVGRVTQANLEKYDEERGNFVDEESDVAPYAHAVLDIPLQLCAIASNTQVANTIPDIANRLASLLRRSSIGVERNYRFVAAPVKNPRSFIAEIRSARRVTRFAVTFSPSNLIDPQRDFLDPFGDYADATRADKGEAEVEGDSLDGEVLEEISRAAASTGEDAKASLVPEDGDRTVQRSLRDNPARLQGQAETTEGRWSVLLRMREIYEEIRSQESDE